MTLQKQVPLNPKTQFISHALVGKVLLITTEDKDFWAQTPYKPLPTDAITDSPEVDTIVLAEVLQKVENPVEYLKLCKQKAKRFIIVVPNEWSWLPQYKPFTNAQHKHQYDADLLAEHLEQARMSYVLKVIDYSGWSFLGAEASA